MGVECKRGKKPRLQSVRGPCFYTAFHNCLHWIDLYLPLMAVIHQINSGCMGFARFLVLLVSCVICVVTIVAQIMQKAFTAGEITGLAWSNLDIFLAVALCLSSLSSLCPVRRFTSFLMSLVSLLARSWVYLVVRPLESLDSAKLVPLIVLFRLKCLPRVKSYLNLVVDSSSSAVLWLGVLRRPNF